MNEEFLLNISEQLENFISLVGGVDYSNLVLDVLVKLCNIDEPIVRDRAVQSMKKIANEMNEEQVEKMFLPALETLADDSWFTCKCSAGMLYPVSL